MSNELIIWSPGMTLDHVERLVILKAYSFYKQNKTATSTALGVSIRTLDERLKKYGHDDTTLEARAKAQSDRDRAFDLRSRGESVHAANSESSSESEEFAHSTEGGVHMEPAEDVPAQPTVPLHVRKKVQGVSSRKASASRARR